MFETKGCFVTPIGGCVVLVAIGSDTMYGFTNKDWKKKEKKRNIIESSRGWRKQIEKTRMNYFYYYWLNEFYTILEGFYTINVEVVDFEIKLML